MTALPRLFATIFPPRWRGLRSRWWPLVRPTPEHDQGPRTYRRKLPGGEVELAPVERVELLHAARSLRRVA